jgi:thioredoxin-like negative regulator of GroEL
MRDYTDKHLEAGEFDKETALVLFWADWCPMCLKLIETFEEIERESTPPYDRAVLLKADFEINPELCKKFDVTVVPTAVSVFGGKVVDIKTGFREKWEFTEMLIRITQKV